jgi:hypothetical protein
MFVEASVLRVGGGSELVQVIKQCDDVDCRPPCRKNLVFLSENQGSTMQGAAISINRLCRTHVN